MDTQTSGPAVQVGDEEINIEVLKDSRLEPRSNKAEMDKATRDVVDQRMEPRPRARKGGLACLLYQMPIYRQRYCP
jgi:hypothetical protein